MTETRIIIGLSTALGVAVLAIIGQNEQIKDLEAKVSKNAALANIWKKAFAQSVDNMTPEQLHAAQLSLTEEEKFIEIMKNF